MSIEDTMFMQALEVAKITRRKSSYEKADRVYLKMACNLVKRLFYFAEIGVML